MEVQNFTQNNFPFWPNEWQMVPSSLLVPLTSTNQQKYLFFPEQATRKTDCLVISSCIIVICTVMHLTFLLGAHGSQVGLPLWYSKKETKWTNWWLVELADTTVSWDTDRISAVPIISYDTYLIFDSLWGLAGLAKWFTALCSLHGRLWVWTPHLHQHLWTHDLQVCWLKRHARDPPWL